MKPAPLPLDWTKTRTQLEAEIAAGHPYNPVEFTWAREYERSLLPPDTVFPVEGVPYEVREDLDVRYITQWNAPFTDGGKTTLRAGDVLITMEPSEDRPLTIALRPRDYAELEARIVPAEVRAEPRYDSFYIQIDTVDLNAKCRRIIYS